jgi:hypothetical protein
VHFLLRLPTLEQDKQVQSHTAFSFFPRTFTIPPTEREREKDAHTRTHKHTYAQEAEKTEEKESWERKAREHEEALTAQGTQLAQAHTELERLRSAEDVLLADIATLRAALLRAFAAGGVGGGSGEMEEVEQECTRERLERGAERRRGRAAEKQVSLLEARLAKASNDLALSQVSTHLRPLFLQLQHPYTLAAPYT